MRGLKLHEWKIINADGEQIDTVLTPTKNLLIAGQKIYEKYGMNAIFLKKEYNKIVER